MSQSVGIQNFDGTTTIQSKEELRYALDRIPVSSSHKFAYRKLRRAYEYKLVPWVMAKPGAFPELLSTPFVFVDIRSVCALELKNYE
jgi:hypothetical protein